MPQENLVTQTSTHASYDAGTAKIFAKSAMAIRRRNTYENKDETVMTVTYS